MQENEDSPALRAVVLGYLRLILEYCKRIYLRQLAKEDNSSSDILKRFHGLLRTYYLDGRQMDLGVPSVQYFAERLAYSPRYLGDVVHKSTDGIPGEIISGRCVSSLNMPENMCSVADDEFVAVITVEGFFASGHDAGTDAEFRSGQDSGTSDQTSYGIFVLFH